MRDRDSEDLGRGFVDCSAFKVLDDPFGSGALFDVIPIRPNVIAGGDNGGEQEEQSCAQPSDSLPQLFEAPFPAGNRVNQLLKKVLLRFGHPSPVAAPTHSPML